MVPRLAGKLNDPVRREMHYFTLLTGIRRGDKRDQWESSGVTTLRWSDVSVRRREVMLRRAKGGRKVVLPISRAACGAYYALVSPVACFILYTL